MGCASEYSFGRGIAGLYYSRTTIFNDKFVHIKFIHIHASIRIQTWVSAEWLSLRLSSYYANHSATMDPPKQFFTSKIYPSISKFFFIFMSHGYFSSKLKIQKSWIYIKFQSERTFLNLEKVEMHSEFLSKQLDWTIFNNSLATFNLQITHFFWLFKYFEWFKFIQEFKFKFDYQCTL